MPTESLTALCGDSWESPRWAVAIDGQPVTLGDWFVRAQARQNSEADAVVLEWTSDDPDRVVIGSAQVQLADGTTITTSTVQLRLFPADWAEVPRKWSGLLEVEISAGDTADPLERRTIVPARKLQIVPDVVHA